MFLKNKYTKWYYELVNYRLTNSILLSEYSETHHIIPISMGGNNNKHNKVRLTAREHYIAHLLLTKMVNGLNKRKMAYALSFFNTACKNHNRYKPKSKLYEMSRRLLSEVRKGIMPNEKCRNAETL